MSILWFSFCVPLYKSLFTTKSFHWVLGFICQYSTIVNLFIRRCKNLNFARRDHCNNCNRPRYASSSGSPRRGYPVPAFPPRQRMPPAPLDHSPPGRIPNGSYRSSPRGWPRDTPRDFRAPPPPPPSRHEFRFSDPLMRQEYPEDDPRDRYRYDRPMLQEWGHRDRGNFNNNERRGFGRRVMSPPPPAAAGPPPRGGWGSSHIRERSRSPVVRGGAPPPSKDYHHHHQRDMYMNNNRRRDDRRGGVGRDGF